MKLLLFLTCPILLMAYLISRAECRMIQVFGLKIEIKNNYRITVTLHKKLSYNSLLMYIIL
jgi:hypothetical protein